MSMLYETLCVVRTSLLNAVGTKYISGGSEMNIKKILNDITDEMDAYGDFIKEITTNMDKDQLIDLGFDYLSNDSELMLFPIWLYPFIPDMTILLDIDGNPIVKGIDTIDIVGNHWINAGFYCVNS